MSGCDAQYPSPALSVGKSEGTSSFTIGSIYEG